VTDPSNKAKVEALMEAAKQKESAKKLSQ